MLKVILGSFSAFPIFVYISKVACRRAKLSEIGASGVSIQCIQGTFNNKVLINKVILGPFGAFLIFSNVSRLCYPVLCGQAEGQSPWASCSSSNFKFSFSRFGF